MNAGEANSPLTEERLLEARYELDLPERHVLAVCEHFSFRPLASFECLNISRGGDPHVYAGRYFARYVTANPLDGNLWDESFDLIICDHAYQDFADSRRLTEEIFRLLKPGGFCYFSGRCRFSLARKMDSGKQTFYRTRMTLRRKLTDFWIHDYAPVLLQNPAAFHCEDMPGFQFHRKLPEFLARRLYPHWGEFVWVLTKMK